MTRFLDVRLAPVGGGLSNVVATNEGTGAGDYHGILLADLIAGVAGRHLLIGAALRETAGNQYFQHLLGYRARNLRLEVMKSGATFTPAPLPVRQVDRRPRGSALG
mgnify:CR=1 FL=1